MSARDQTTGRSNHLVSAILCGIFFLSGASALIFETLWFRLAGLTFGNSVWASALVLSSFMGGMALGNGIAAAYGRRVRRPVRLYALAEIAIGASGIGLVVLFPALPGLLAPLFATVLDHPAVLNGLRLAISFGLMMIPATAMGITLPLLVKALSSGHSTFGAVLGRLYGWNTLGAVAGALLAEAALIGPLGLRGTGVVACALNTLCAVAALWMGTWNSRLSGDNLDVAGPETERVPASLGALSVLAAGFLSGAILLALEVIWFRFLILFFNAYSIAFATMLAVVLAGIGVGGMLASLWFRIQPTAHRYLTATALLSGAVSILVYAGFHPKVGAESAGSPFEWSYMVALSFPLIFPVSLLSGILFTLIGQAAHDKIGESTETTGLLTMVNTAGAMLGSIIAGLVLLPKLGMEKSFFLLSLGYAAVALCAVSTTAAIGFNRSTLINAVAAAVFVLCVVGFPFGAMEAHILSVGRASFPQDPGWQPKAIREGLTETSQYWQKHLFGNLLYTRLLTNNHPMSSTAIQAKRYMNYFVYWPVAIHPNPKTALLICYGVGATAKALTDTKQLDSIDVVDISSDILDNSAIIYPNRNDNPLYDPRVTIHVEDGRFFLQTTAERFDIITAEPPPPLVAGVVNLYSQEYFQLIHDRLQDGGIVTYWLPVWQMPWSAAQSIVKGFCNVFEDCSLWTGTAFEWMLVGMRKPGHRASEERFRQQWQDPISGPQLRLLGFEQPEQIGATFIMDSVSLREWARNIPPLVDNFPRRIFGKPSDVYEYTLTDLEDVMNPDHCRDRFEKSSFIEKTWPENLRKSSLDFFRFQNILNEGFIHPGWADPVKNIQYLHTILTGTSLRFPVFLTLGGPESLDVARVLGTVDPALAAETRGMSFGLGVRSLADRDFGAADKFFAQEQQTGGVPYLSYYRVYALCMAGRMDDARKVAKEDKVAFSEQFADGYRKWLNETFGW